MNTFLHKILFSCTALLVIGWSCKKDEQRVVIQSGKPSVLTPGTQAVVLADTAAASQAIVFNWTAADFGYSAAIDYTLQFDKKGDAFAKAQSVDAGVNLSSTFTVAALNNLAMKAGLTAFAADSLEVRVQAKVSDAYITYSPSVTVLVTSYLSEPPYADLYLVGDATDNGWDNTRASPLQRDATDPFIYNYTGYLNTGGIKFLGYLNKWAPSWGSDGTATGVVFRATDADADPATFPIATPGYYTVQLNLKNTTYSIKPVDASAAATYQSVGVIGDFNNWTDIVPFTATATNPHIWQGSVSFSSNAQFKFRIASGWDVNWGVGTDTGKLYGVAQSGGNNISMAAGKYTVVFNDITLQYIFIKQ